MKNNHLRRQKTEPPGAARDHSRRSSTRQSHLVHLQNKLAVTNGTPCWSLAETTGTSSNGQSISS
ncbi:hypothetical protein DF150_33445 [Burkholderia cenocepacia]|nr:hypothetical protein DF150_33445 [Burkholderia cenocepacia]